MKFEITGNVTMKGQTQGFTKQIEAQSEKLAVEKVYAQYGADNRLKRTHVKIEAVKKL